MIEHITISEATTDDAVGIVQVRRTTWLATYPNAEANISVQDIEEAVNKRTVEEEAEKVKERLNTDLNFHTWVARDDARVVGFITAVRQEGRNRIGALYVLPEFQKKGIGRELMNKALQWLGNEKEVFFEVVTYNTSAITFYKNQGFRENGATTNAVGNLPSGKVLPEIEMVKEVGTKVLI